MQPPVGWLGVGDITQVTPGEDSGRPTWARKEWARRPTAIRCRRRRGSSPFDTESRLPNSGRCKFGTTLGIVPVVSAPISGVKKDGGQVVIVIMRSYRATLWIKLNAGADEAREGDLITVTYHGPGQWSVWHYPPPEPGAASTNPTELPSPSTPWD
eukprot:3474825-Pyramimonas_sp.AAC.1